MNHQKTIIAAFFVEQKFSSTEVNCIDYLSLLLLMAGQALPLRMWKSVCNVSNLTHFGYKKRMTFYLLLFIFYAIQLALYRKGLNQGTIHDSEINADYLIAVDVLLLVITIVALGCGWIFRPIFQNISIVVNALIFGLTFGWLILAAPHASDHQAYYGINGLVVLILIVVDVSVMFYVRPEIIAVQQSPSPQKHRNAKSHNSKSKQSSTTLSVNNSSPIKMSTTDKLRGAVSSILPSYGKVRHRFLHSEDDANIHLQNHANGPMANKLDEEMGEITAVASDRDEFVNSFNSPESIPSTNGSALRRQQHHSLLKSSSMTTSSSPFHLNGKSNNNRAEDEEHIMDMNDESEDDSQPPEEVIFAGYKIDTNNKSICEGFRVNMGNLPSFDSGETPRNLTWEDFTHIQHIVDSSSCHIYTALWKQQPVVLKLIKAERVSSAVAVAEFEAEEGVLSRIRHPNIVRFLGSGKSPRKFLVLELLSGGSLSHTLGLRGDSKNQTWEKRFTFLETLDFALSLARALKYLHHDWSPSVHIIHRDLKPDNIGFAGDGRVKLFDFGLCASVRAQREKTEQYRLTGNTGTLRYMAPEVVLGRSYHQSVDVYSFGILLWQVASGKIPFRDMGKKTYFDRVVVGGQRPRIDTRWPLGFATLLRQCWHEDKHARPNFITIVQELEVLIRQEEMLALAQYNRFHRRILRHMVWVATRFRPLFCFGLVVMFVSSLWMVVDEDDTVVGAILGAVSTFGIYVILMSYLSIWPFVSSSSPSSNSHSSHSSKRSQSNILSKWFTFGSSSNVNDDNDLEAKIDHQRRMRALTANAKILHPGYVESSAPSISGHDFYPQGKISGPSSPSSHSLSSSHKQIIAANTTANNTSKRVGHKLNIAAASAAVSTGNSPILPPPPPVGASIGIELQPIENDNITSNNWSTRATNAISTNNNLVAHMSNKQEQSSLSLLTPTEV